MSLFTIEDDIKLKLLEEFESLIKIRGEPNSELDQYFLTIESSLNRILLFNPLDYQGKRVIFLGDMDLSSFFLGKLSKPKDMAIIDIDPRVPDLTYSLKMEHKIRSVRYINHDLRTKTLAVVKDQYDFVFVESPMTLEALEVWLSRAVQCVNHHTRGYIILTCDIEENKKSKVTDIVEKMGLEIVKVVYEGAKYAFPTPLNKYSSDVYIIKSNENSRETIVHHYFGPTYYREIKNPPYPYRCKCGTIIKIGEDGDYKTVEELEEKGCPQNCGYTGKFIYNSSVEIE